MIGGRGQKGAESITSASRREHGISPDLTTSSQKSPATLQRLSVLASCRFRLRVNGQLDAVCAASVKRIMFHYVLRNKRLDLVVDLAFELAKGTALLVDSDNGQLNAE